MENRSNHIVVGVVTLALLVAVAIFAVWLARLGESDQKQYDIFFKQAVGGLARGSGVAFAGVPVGQVQSISLWRSDPEFVRVRISINEDVPILQGTTATIEGIGFTGVSQIQLDGAVKGAPPISDLGPEGVPVIPTKPGALGEILNSAPQLVERLSTLTARLNMLLSDENRDSITNMLDNIETLTGELARQGPEYSQTLKEARIAVAQVGKAAEEIAQLADTTDEMLGEEGKPLMRDLRQTIKSARGSMEALEGALEDARPGLQTLSNRTLPEAQLLIKDLRDMSAALKSVTERLDQQGAGAVLGPQELPDYEPK